MRSVSDHCPVILDSTPPSRGPTPFHFKNIWLNHTSFNIDFGNWWKDTVTYGWEGHKFMTKLETIKEKMKKWNVEVFGDLRLQKQSLLRRIKELDVLESSGTWNNYLKEERSMVKGKLERILMQEERAVRMKSKITWAKEGDANTNLFHRLMNALKAKNVITRLEVEDGIVVDNEVDIVQVISDFFSTLYKSDGLSYQGIEGIEWKPISSHMSDWLERPFEEEKINKATFECDGSKASGPDGSTLELFQTQWETVKGNIIRVLSEFVKDGIIHGVTNETYICLIHKKANSSKVKDYRPISLVTSLYKIISKVLSNRLQGVLEDTIAETQGAFVAGRQILDVMLVANELVEEYRKTGKAGFVFKIDFEKAYDYVEWGFLDYTMEKKRFSPIWRNWIRDCLSTVSFSVFINGRPRGKFKDSRGLRQGDPLSPFGLLW